ncbi:uncharacterized protein DUF3969 [Cytobacillus horneckiae]|uniref:DUF3969 domain-containing protein n=1 Tax=Cytobacillus horneckiae TaxID=549687 RepID=A0A2N0ZJ75_9BACI|nr:DUF3969 family protein [Cytobacillus horneckiae]MBN6888494.1 DUF3969 family protein [Cytobacillus horneckiae]MCM3180288.1 DUF3969 family protein [Cytobacillus horneckiae]MEC1156464.1 DUF3969 family protein [Cytobacillus horneckiae]MED2938481.1 DUF3969 family protein [Cytobacillus horneckiae]PKG29544.1 DUF3969 domain-containing protein [Cytobacillus horneckiae]
MDQLLLNATSKEELEKILLLNVVGLIEGINENSITIEEAEKVLFSPYIMKLVDSMGISKEVLEVIHLGTELEDVESLIPEKLPESLIEIKEKSINLLEKRKEHKFQDKVIKKY